MSKERELLKQARVALFEYWSNESANASPAIKKLSDEIAAYLMRSERPGIRVRAWTDNSDIHAITDRHPANATLVLDDGEWL